ncbi:glyoxalase superfamily protein [Aliihoeflea sp. PC F10.4]
MTNSVSAFKDHARRLRTALKEDGIEITHSKALELVARQEGVRDWNVLAARPETQEALPFTVGDAVSGTFNGKPAKGHVHALAKTIKPDLWRMTVTFDPPVDVVTSPHFSAERRRVEMVVGKDGRSRRLTGTETGVAELARV